MKIYISTESPKKTQYVAPAFSLMSLGGLGSDVISVKQEVSLFFQPLNKERENLLCAREWRGHCASKYQRRLKGTK